MVMNPFHSVGRRERPTRLRRSCLAVPGSDEKMMGRAMDSGADQIFLDLEDSVAPNEKKGARKKVVEALNTHDYGKVVTVVRVNGVTTRWCYDDIIEVIRGAGDKLDCIMIPKVQNAGEMWFVENLLNQLEQDLELDQRVGLEAQIETGTGSVNMRDIAAVTDRIEALVFGPGDYAADQGIVQLDLGKLEGEFPGYQWQYINSQIVNNARAVGCQAIDGPFAAYGDPEGYREMAKRAKLVGMDGKWCIHPSQIELANEVFSPSKEEFDFAQRMLEAYREAIEAGKGAAKFEGKMIDEASRKMAEKIVRRGEAAGLG